MTRCQLIATRTATTAKKNWHHDPFDPDWSKGGTRPYRRTKACFLECPAQNRDHEQFVRHRTQQFSMTRLGQFHHWQTTRRRPCQDTRDLQNPPHRKCGRSDLVAKLLNRQANDLVKLRLNILGGSVKRKPRPEMIKKANEQQTLINCLISPVLREKIWSLLSFDKAVSDPMRRMCAAEVLMVSH